MVIGAQDNSLLAATNDDDMHDNFNAAIHILHHARNAELRAVKRRICCRVHLSPICKAIHILLISQRLGLRADSHITISLTS